MNNWLETSVQDLRFAIRSFRRSPGFAVAAIATLALGIGANTAIFSVVSGVLLRPLPFPDSERLVELNEVQPWAALGPVTVRDLMEWRTHSSSLEGLAGYFASSKNLQNVSEPEQVATISAEREIFQTLGATALAGRTFSGGDSDNVVVASAAFWKRRLAADPAAVGRTITLDGQPFTVIGVMPEWFQFPYQTPAADLWLPWRGQANSNGRVNRVVARLKPRVSPEAARSELSAMSERAQPGRAAIVTPLRDVIAAKIRQSLIVLLGAVGMVLLVACVNVANLLLARGAARTQEIAIRTALGAGRWRLIRQVLAESLMLSFTGGIAGLAIGLWGGRMLVQAAAAQIPRATEIGFDWRVFAFLFAACLVTGIAFGFAPALAAARAGATALKTRSLRWVFRDGLVVVEVALAFVLLTGAGLLLRTFLNLQRTDSGLNPSEVLTLHVVVSGASDLAAIEERAARLPGVHAVGFVSLLPLQSTGWAGFSTVRGRPERFETELRYVTPGYFQAIGIPLRRGRWFTPRDIRGGKTVVVINEALARQQFPNEDPVGRELDRGTIIGVVGDVHSSSLSHAATPEIYYAIAQNFAQLPSNGTTLVVRGQPSAQSLAAAIREVNPNHAVFRVLTMEKVVWESLASQRLYLWLLGLFAGLGTLLAAAGIYGVIAYLVTVRTREFGIRMALGADSFQVLRLVMGRGSVLVGLGLVLGTGGALVLTRFLKNVLFGVAATDPVTFVGMGTTLAIVALAACLAPARRAAGVSPAVALGGE